MATPPAHPSRSPASPALLDYVLRTMQVTTQLCSRQRHERDYACEYRTVPDYNFIYVIRGHAVWVVAGIEYELPPEHLIIVPPGVWHHGYCRTQAITLGSLHVLATLPGGQDVFALLAPPMLQEIAPESRFDRYFRSFMDEFDRPSAEERLEMFPGWAHLITRELFRDSSRRGLLRPRPEEPVVAALLDDLDRHLDHAVTLDSLARRSGYSAQHLNRLFTRVLGTTPLKYLAKRRMQRAAELLRSSTLAIAEVARRVGHADPDYFSRQFAAQYGISASEYRRQAGAKNPV